jgi:hypothetical protein
MLGAGVPQTSYESLADWPLGRRNQALAQLRCACFGARLQGWVSCAQCGGKMEFDMDGRAFASTAAGDGNYDGSLSVRGHCYRLPTTRDLSRGAREKDSRRAAMRILESCRLDPQKEAAELSEEELNELGERMALADPLAEILIDLRCPGCGVESSETLDIVSFLWAEIEARAKQLLGEIHVLASAYGWTENEVLTLSDHRRALYVEMVSG